MLLLDFNKFISKNNVFLIVYDEDNMNTATPTLVTLYYSWTDTYNTVLTMK